MRSTEPLRMKEYDESKGCGYLSIPFKEVMDRQKEGEEIKSIMSTTPSP